MPLLTILISGIDASAGLRAASPAWSQTMAEQVDGDPRWPAIDVVDLGAGRYRLVDGRRRLAAAIRKEMTTIEARVFTRAEFADEAAEQLHEIRANLLQSGTTALERAVYLATWKALHEAVNGPAKRGRKSAAELAQNSAAIFSGQFSAIAAETLGISERSVQASVQVATGIDRAIRDRIAHHPVARVMSELLELATQAPERQTTIVDLLLAEPVTGATPTTIAEAIAIIDKLPAPRALAPWETAYARISKLPDTEQDRLFDAMASSIERWYAARRRTARKAA